MSSRKSSHRVSIPSGADGSGLSGGSSHHHHFHSTISSTTSHQHPLQYYWQRLTDYQGWDVQAALDQMKSLVNSLHNRSALQNGVYKTAYYRKQTKNHWFRDDPSFMVLQLVFLLIAVVAYSVAFKCSVSRAVSFGLLSIGWNWLGMGVVLASVCRHIANQHLCNNNSAAAAVSGTASTAATAAPPRSTTNTTHVQQSVEWLFAMDIHCNAFFVVFCLLYGLQFFLLPLVLGESFASLLLSNTLYAAALSWYWYIVHVGYRSLPFLQANKTQLYLVVPVSIILLVYVLNIAAHVLTAGHWGWNASRIVARFYFM